MRYALLPFTPSLFFLGCIVAPKQPEHSYTEKKEVELQISEVERHRMQGH